MPKIIKQGVVYGSAPSASVWEGTQAQYDAITTPDPNVTYFITDGVVNPVPATNISYNNTSSGLAANTVQGAIDEVTTKSVTITPKTGYSVIRFSGGKNDKLVGFNTVLGSTNNIPAGSWVTFGTIDALPTIHVTVPFSNIIDGTYGGIVTITEAGAVNVYAQQSLNRVTFSISYVTA